ncbi:MAG: hypothetical protein H6R17_945 [Proteobacteria bacterium]|nr:hypothetical protein [Pseudomonadota bacterium]
MTNPSSPSAAAKAPKTIARKLPAKTQAAAPTKAKAAVKRAVPAKTPAPARTPVPAKASKPVTAAREASKTSAKAVADKLGKDGKHSGKKPKLVRDSFTFPAAEYALFGTLKQRALKSGHEVKKSELLRAGLASLAALPDSALLKALQGIDRLKPGRPVK